jgi:hypothetical protein
MGLSKCEGCPRNCCENFKLTLELTNSQNLPQFLEKYPYIRRVGNDVVLDEHGHEKTVGVYACDRFDKTTQTCINHDTEERPSFCINTGEKIAPHNQCLLKRT